MIRGLEMMVDEETLQEPRPLSMETSEGDLIVGLQIKEGLFIKDGWWSIVFCVHREQDKKKWVEIAVDFGWILGRML